MSRGKSKAINVKIATSKVIKALEIKLDQIKKDKANQKNNEEKYKKDMEKYQEEVGKLALAQIAKAVNIRTCVRYSGVINIDFDLPAKTFKLPDEPQREFEIIHDHSYHEMVEEIENAIRILKMTDEEFVNTSTYNSIAKYL